MKQQQTYKGLFDSWHYEAGRIINISQTKNLIVN